MKPKPEDLPYFAPPAEGQRVPETGAVPEAELELLQEDAELENLVPRGVFAPHPIAGGAGRQAELEKRVKQLELLVARLLKGRSP